MTELARKRCQPCEGGIPPISPNVARTRLAELEGTWQLAEEGRALVRELKFVDFYRTMSFVNALAHIANTEDHHPDLQVGYDYCRVRFSTHAIGGLSENDFICAAKLDLIAQP